jgi:hypothetical protein
MNKSPLVPVRVTDKNGVLTTRHKKIASAPASARSAIPAPTSTPRVSPEKAVALLTSLKLVSEESTTYQYLFRVITTEMSVSEYDTAAALLSGPANDSDGTRYWMVQEILQQPVENFWRLDVATGLAHETSLHSKWHLPFVRAMEDEGGYGSTVREYSGASLEDQKKLCAVANALAEIESQYYDNAPPTKTVERKFLRKNSQGAMIIYNKPLFRALLDHPEKAAQIAKMYVQRWSLDALDEVLSAPSAISEGAL